MLFYCKKSSLKPSTPKEISDEQRYPVYLPDLYEGRR